MEGVESARVQPTAERDRLARLFQPILAAAPFRLDIDEASVALRLGLAAGDDAAVLHCEGVFDLVVSSDYVRGSKFRLFEAGALRLYDIGYYLVAANLSDIAAMGAAPVGVLTVVRYPDDMTDEQLGELLRGIADSARAHGTAVIGGDTGSAERLVLAATALGACQPGRALTRAGARPGDGVWVTTPLGLAGVALHRWMRGENRDGLTKDDIDQLLLPWRQPWARLDLGRTLVEHSLASACLDVSDGLLAALENLTSASGVGAEIDGDNFPVHPLVSRLAKDWGVDPLDASVSASVDFALLFTVPPQHEPRMALLANSIENPPMRIGVIRGGSGVTVLRRGRYTEMQGLSWDHTTSVEEFAEKFRHLS